MYQRNPIGDMLERINTADGISSPLHRIDFLMGTRYYTGSDYHLNALLSEIGQLMGYSPCKACEGTGSVYRANSGGEAEKDICDYCEGSRYEGVDDSFAHSPEGFALLKAIRS